MLSAVCRALDALNCWNKTCLAVWTVHTLECICNVYLRPNMYTRIKIMIIISYLRLKSMYPLRMILKVHFVVQPLVTNITIDLLVSVKTR